MKRLIIFYMFVLCGVCFAKREKENKDLLLIKEIEELKWELEAEQSKLQDLTEKRWTKRQKQVKTKEKNKEKLEVIQQQAERIYSDISRAREEFLTYGNTLENEKEGLEQNYLEIEMLSQAVDKKMEKESKLNFTGFPLGQDAYIAKLDKIDKIFLSKKYPARKFSALLNYKLRRISSSRKIVTCRQTLLEDGNTPVAATIIRIGRCLAYAKKSDQSLYYLGNTGKRGKDSFLWRKIANPEMAAVIDQSFSLWIKNRMLTGNLPVDILQNKFSSSLVRGDSGDWKSDFREFVMTGGPVLIPLGLIVLWALLIIMNKIIVYLFKYRTDRGFIRKAIDFLSKKEIDKARKLAEKRKTVHSRVLMICLNNQKLKRSAAEKAVREQLLSEISPLDKHLETLAVLAAVSPLLGLLGTVTGMIKMFEAITRFGTGDPKLLAGGISEALITTEVGLSIAIPLLLIHNFLRNRRNRIKTDLEMYAMKFLNNLWPED